MWKQYEVNENIKIKSFISAFCKSIDDNYVFHGETHDFWEIFYVDKGNVCVSADESVFELSKNELIIHKPMEIHKFHVKPGKSAKIYVLSFTLSGESTHLFENLCIKLSKTQAGFFKNIISLIHENELIKEKINNSNQKSFLCSGTEIYNVNNYFLQQLACATELFLLSCIQEITTPVPISQTADAIFFNKAVNIMVESIYEWITVSQIAKKCNLSTTHLKSLFTNYTGLGVHKYFLNLKITHAMDLLKSGKTVAEVSQELNFCSQTYFSTVFKRETGLTPREYKNNQI